MSAARGILVVTVRAGRSERPRRQIETHAALMAGSDAAFDALFLHRQRLLRAETVDERWETITLLSSPRRPARGGLSATLCSGGARALLLDDAASPGMALAGIPSVERAEPAPESRGIGFGGGGPARYRDAARPGRCQRHTASGTLPAGFVYLPGRRDGASTPTQRRVLRSVRPCRTGGRAQPRRTEAWTNAT